MSAFSLPRLLMADDHLLVLDLLKTMMKDHFEVLAVDSGQAFLQAVDEFRPDIAVLDVSMPDEDGFLTAQKVLDQWPELPIVFLSMHSDGSYAYRAAQVGAKAYLSKQLPAHQLIIALQKVMSGSSLFDTSDDNAETPKSKQLNLTARQIEVLGLIALGCTAKEVANKLNISVRTAEFHRATIMQRLNLHNTAQLTRYAIENELG